MEGHAIEQISIASASRASFMTIVQHLPMVTINRKNGIIQMQVANCNNADTAGLQIVILDWEKSGWYPAYWEYCPAVCALRWDDDWCL